MMTRCHDYIAHYCLSLKRLVHHVQVQGADAPARKTAAQVLRYFETEGRCHHEDEERDLFPRLLTAAGGRGAERAASLIARLRSEHRDMECSWQVVRDDLERIANGDGASLCKTAVERFDSVHCEHMRVEEEELMPLARSLLQPSELAAVGRAMVERRGAIPPGKPGML